MLVLQQQWRERLSQREHRHSDDVGECLDVEDRILGHLEQRLASLPRLGDANEKRKTNSVKVEQTHGELLC